MKKALIIISVVVIGLFGFLSMANTSGETLKKGDHIPQIELFDQKNQLYNVNDFEGAKNLVIYFYPKDDTPGCTKEACSFRDEFELFTDLNALVIGISSDSRESHQEFADKYNLPFALLSDPENVVRDRFGVKPEYLGLLPGRVTFIVDKTGTIQYVFSSLNNAEQHVEEAKKILISLN